MTPRVRGGYGVGIRGYGAVVELKFTGIRCGHGVYFGTFYGYGAGMEFQFLYGGGGGDEFFTRADLQHES